MQDMERAVDRWRSHRQSRRKFWFTVIRCWWNYLGCSRFQLSEKFYSDCDFYIPDRYSEGYGVSKQELYGRRKWYSLIIALDLGIKASDMVTLAAHKGIDLLSAISPSWRLYSNAAAVLDPKRSDCNYPFNELMVVVSDLSWFRIRKIQSENEVFDIWISLLLVSLPTLFPSMENRTLAYFGLQKIKSNPRPDWRRWKKLLH